jgi:phosphatidate cytidylyltransferase
MRALTGAVFVIVLVASIVWRYESFALLFLLITILGTWEFYRLAGRTGASPQKIYGTFAAAVLFCSCSFAALDEGNYSILAINVPLLFVPFLVELYRKKENPFTNIAYTLLGLVYVALPFSLWNLLIFRGGDGCLTNGQYKYHILLGYFILMWTSDTGAYLSGKAFGKHKLFERVSPKKTWEGTIGGGILCLAGAYILSVYFTDLRLVDWLIVGIIIVIAGNLGDLAESLFKRSIDIKDSGNILPGHGGILDRFDAVLISTPFVSVYLALSHPHWIH